MKIRSEKYVYLNNSPTTNTYNADEIMIHVQWVNKTHETSNMHCIQINLNITTSNMSCPD